MAGQDERSRRTVVLSPHFDDAVLDCWSVLARDPACVVVNVFTGAPRPGLVAWWDRANGATDSASHVAERVVEDRSALGSVGKAPIDLGYLEAQYRMRQSNALHRTFHVVPPVRQVATRLPVVSRWIEPTPAVTPAELAARVVAEVPDVDLVCVPAGIGGHPDHVIVRDTAGAFMERGIRVRLHADLPYAVRMGWPTWLDETERRPDPRVDPFWERHLHGVRGFPGVRSATVVRLDSDERAAKDAAVRCYATQFTSLTSGRSKDRLTDDEVLAREVTWDLVPDRGVEV